MTFKSAVHVDRRLSTSRESLHFCLSTQPNKSTHLLLFVLRNSLTTMDQGSYCALVPSNFGMWVLVCIRIDHVGGYCQPRVAVSDCFGLR